MADTFNIVITATDKASATIRQINSQFAKLTAPFEQVGKSFKRFGSELGLDKVGKQIAKVGVSARDTAQHFASMLTPLAVITSAASIGGIMAMANSWAKMGRTVTLGAQALGVSNKEFQHMRNLGQLSGAGAEAVTNAYGELRTTMQDARWGRNNNALVAMNRVGVGLKLTKDGALDVKAEMEGLRKVIMSPEYMKDPAKQQVVAQATGVQAMLPIWRQGEEAWKRYQATLSNVEYASPFMDVAKRMDESIEGLKIAAGGLATSIGDKVFPVFQPLIDQLTNWITQNRELISQKVGEWAQDVAKWIKSIDWKKVGEELTKFIDGIGKLIDWLGGAKNAIIALVAVMNAGLIFNVIRLGGLLIGPLFKAGTAIVKMFWDWSKAADAAAASTEAAGAASSAGTLAKGLLGKAGLVAGAGVAGWEAGSFISKHYIEGTSFGDKLGSMLVHGAAAVGIKSAQASVARMDKADMLDQAQKRAKANPRATQQALEYFQSQGWTKQQAAGITANLLEESGLNPTIPGDNGAAYGIGQWHKDRQEQFAKVFGHPIQGSTLKEQMQFVQWELTHTEKAAGDKLRVAQGGGMAGDTVSRFYERPGAVEEAAANRAALAQQILAQYSTAANPLAAPAGPGAPAPAGPMAGAQGAPGATGKTVIEIQAAPGTNAKVRQQADNVSVAPRIGTTAIGAASP